jgi:hypothetical protein
LATKLFQSVFFPADVLDEEGMPGKRRGISNNSSDTTAAGAAAAAGPIVLVAAAAAADDAITTVHQQHAVLQLETNVLRFVV